MNNAERTFLDLTRPAVIRLAAVKMAYGSNWRDERARLRLDNFRSYCGYLDQGTNGTPPHESRVWYTHQGEQFRGECFADEVRYDGDGRKILDHNGWYTDGEVCDEVARGIVARLPHGRFIAGYYLSMNGERVYFDDVYTDEVDAVRAADEHARVIGETESEYQNRYNAASNLSDKIERHLGRVRECLLLRHTGKGKTRGYVASNYRAEARELIEKIRKDREILETDYKDVEL